MQQEAAFTTKAIGAIQSKKAHGLLDRRTSAGVGGGIGTDSATLNSDRPALRRPLRDTIAHQIIEVAGQGIGFGDDLLVDHGCFQAPTIARLGGR
jgi:hypothetical protein